MADKKQNPVIIAVLIIAIIGGFMFTAKRIGCFRKPGRPVASGPSVSLPPPVMGEPRIIPQARGGSQPQAAPRAPADEKKPEKKITAAVIKAELKRLTSGYSYDTQPVFSPNDMEIAFASLNKEGQNIYILKLNSPEEPMRLTKGNYIDSHPAWALDGKRIIFSSNRHGKDNELFWVDRFTGDITPLDKEGASPVLSPDGEWLSFVDQHNIWIMRLATKEFYPLTTTGYNDWPSWDIEGKKIYFSCSGFIKVFDINKSELRPVISSGFCDYPAISLKNNTLVYVSLESGRYDLWMMNPDGSGRVQLTGDEAREYFPSWSPDGRSIVFASDASGLSHLWLLTLK